ncbi:hypothetical protein Fot_19456 [Forsythia ovata]|uniref:Uncharacterized protein n=1 Tax=Forsythia ovata TaxID=205694 RepID=A0ABD1VL32_9LAMI
MGGQMLAIFLWLDLLAHDRYKSVINGLLRNKSVTDKEKEVVSWKFEIYQIVSALVLEVHNLNKTSYCTGIGSSEFKQNNGPSDGVSLSGNGVHAREEWNSRG